MSKTEKWVYVILATLATFLMIDRYLLPCLVGVGIIFGFLFAKDYKLYLSKLMIPMVIICVMVLTTIALSIIPQFSRLIHIRESVKELMRVAVYIMVLQIMTTLKIDVQFHNKVWKVITAVTVVVVVLQYTKIIDMNQMLIDFYSYSKQFIYAESDDLSKFRGGSVFVNPNVFACFLSAMLANYLLTLRMVKETNVSKIVMFGLIMTGIIFAGSRTGMILAMLLILYHVYATHRLRLGKFVKKIVLILAAVVAGMYLFSVVFSVEFSLWDLRMFQVEAGIENSFGTKVEILTNMISKMNVANLLVGYGVYDYANNFQYMVDFDLGYFIAFFGLSGLLSYFFMLHGIYSWGDRSLPGRKARNVMLLLIVIVFGLTAGVYFNLRIFTIYLLVFMPSMIDANTQQRLT